MSKTTEQAAQNNVSVRREPSESVPGDLLVSEVMERIEAQKHQFRHDNILVPSAPLAGQAVEVWATTGDEMPLERAVLYYTVDGSMPDLTSTALPLKKVRSEWGLLSSYLTHWQAVIPAQPAQTIVRYRIGGWYERTQLTAEPNQEPDIWAQDGQGFWFRYSGKRAITTFAYTVHATADEAILPAWAREAIIYQIFLDRFRTSEPDGSFQPHDSRAIHGGTLRGVCAALPYLSELGVNCLWISPINPAETYHRYDATDFYDVDHRLGTKEDLKTLTEQAHARGIRVILDFVPNHSSWHHPALLAAQQDRNAPSYDWYDFVEWPHNFRSFMDIQPPMLASFNTNSAGAREYIIGSALQWMRDYGIDGFRLDHAIGPSMDFWIAFRRAIRAVSPDAISIGEATDTVDSLKHYHGKLDSILDFPLASALRHFFALEDWSIENFEHDLHAYEEYMTDGPSRVSFLDNHDMNRFMFMANNDTTRLKLAALCQFTLTPTPVVYYGTEVGMTQEYDSRDRAHGGDAQIRQDMSWNPADWDQDLLAYYRRLIALRRTYPVLHTGKRRLIALDEQHKLYGYAQAESNETVLPKGSLLTLFNLSEEQQHISLPAACLSGICQQVFTTASAATVQTSEESVDITLAPRSAGAFVLA